VVKHTLQIIPKSKIEVFDQEEHFPPTATVRRFLPQVAGLQYHRIKLTPRADDYEEEIVWHPHWHEFWGSATWLRLKLAAEKRGIKVTSFGSMCQFPLFSILSDEVVMLKPEMGKFTQDLKTPIGLVRKHPGYHKEFKAARWGQEPSIVHSKKWLSFVRDTSYEEVAERFASVTVSIRRSSYELYNRLKPEFHNNRLYVISKRGVKFPQVEFCYPQVNNSWSDKYYGLYPHDFMSLQLLLSLFHNWWFYCYMTGAAAMCGILPVKWAGGRDCSVEHRTEIPIHRSIGKRRHGRTFMPYVGKEMNQKIADQINKNILEASSPKIEIKAVS